MRIRKVLLTVLLVLGFIFGTVSDTAAKVDTPGKAYKEIVQSLKVANEGKVVAIKLLDAGVLTEYKGKKDVWGYVLEVKLRQVKIYAPGISTVQHNVLTIVVYWKNGLIEITSLDAYSEHKGWEMAT